MRKRGRMQCLKPIRPVSLAAYDAHHDQLCMARRALHIAINRHRMRETQEIGESQTWPYAWPALHKLISLGKTGQFGVGSGKEQYVTRRLAKIDGLVAVVNRTFLGK